MKIGLLGGSFNPIHNGHIKIAKAVLEKTDLDKIWFVPSGNHPLKPNKELKPVETRIAFIEKAIEHYANFSICTLDANSSKPSYTTQLISSLKKSNPDDQFYFIAGFDIVEELPLWHEYRWLLDNLNFLIINRPNIDKSNWDKLDYLDKLTFIEMEPIDISSSEIRRKIANNETISGLVPAEIEAELLVEYKI